MASAGSAISVVTAWLCLAAAAGADSPSSAPAPAGAAREFRFHRDGILGTSMDLTVRTGDEARARAVEQAVTDEIRRCAAILSTYDANSEISRLARARQAVKCSPELLEVLSLYDQWQSRSGGAFCGQLGEVIDLWKQAAKQDRLPDESQLAAAVEKLKQPAWTIDRAAGEVLLRPGCRLNIDAMGKGYIIDRALAAGRARDASAAGMMLAIGGDLAAWGRASGEANSPWRIALTDPLHPADNAPPLLRISLRDRACATSAHYARFYAIGGKRYSHIIDPRTGRPVEGILSATVLAPRCATADALATILCVLPPKDGLDLVRHTEGADCFIITADDIHLATRGFNAIAPKAPASQPAASQPATAWPKGFELAISLTLPKTRLRPYVAIWVEDASGAPLRTLTVWGDNPKYMRKLTTWWKSQGGNSELDGVTRSTRPAGKYSLVWNGLDDQGKPVGVGKYTVRIETAREEGPHTHLKGTIDCGQAAATGTIQPNGEVEEVLLRFGPTEEKK